MAQLLIHDGKVIQIEDETFPVHKDLQWVEGEASVGDSYVNGKIIPYVEPVEIKTWLQERKEAYARAFRITDQIDIIQKQFRSMSDKGEAVLTEETQAWLDKIALIKSDNPKPTE